MVTITTNHQQKSPIDRDVFSSNINEKDRSPTAELNADARLLIVAGRCNSILNCMSRD